MLYTKAEYITLANKTSKIFSSFLLKQKTQISKKKQTAVLVGAIVTIFVSVTLELFRNTLPLVTALKVRAVAIRCF